MLEKQTPTLVFIGKGFNKSCQPVQQAQPSMISPPEKGNAAGGEELVTGRVCGAPSAGVVLYGFGKSRDQGEAGWSRGKWKVHGRGWDEL